MLTYIEAQQQLFSLAGSFGKEEIDIQKSVGRVLAEDIVADRHYPPFHRAAMDGYAFSFAEYQKGRRQFEIAEVIYAGQANTKSLSPDQCCKIMTGAALPGSVDTVVRREDVNEAQMQAHVLVECQQYQHTARQGEDSRSGKTMVSCPRICTPSVIALLASVGKARVFVEKLPAVAVFTTGDEVVGLDQVPTPIQIRNSNQYLLGALLYEWQIDPSLSIHIRDDKTALRRSFETALQHDLIIICGGVSAGDADYVPGVLDNLGIKKLFHKLSIKPGKPIWCGQLPNGRIVFALPGNPFSCEVCFKLFINPYLSTCFGLQPKALWQLPLLTPKLKKTPLDEFFPVRLTRRPTLALESIVFNGSGDITAGLQADGLAIHPSKSPELLPGDLVEFIPAGELA